MSEALASVSVSDELLRKTQHWIDTRAPKEFAQGSLPGAVSLPLMNDEERHRVGLCYAERGQDAAIALGHHLVSGEIKAERVARWAAFARQHPQVVLFCWRGGLRSRISQAWIHEASGLEVLRVRGGYKAVRQHLLQRMENFCAQPAFPLLVVSGRTGCGKTRLLHRLSRTIDLEGLANHRGSAFGRRVTPQPTQLNFENALAQQLIRLGDLPQAVVLEDESPAVGSLAIPKAFYAHMAQSTHVFLEASLEQRVVLTREEYIDDSLAEYQRIYGAEAGWQQWSEQLSQSLWRIRKRLGGARYQTLHTQMQQALAQQAKQGRSEGHEAWIAFLLQDYYDPMYDYQIQSKAKQFAYRAEREELQAYLHSVCSA